MDSAVRTTPEFYNGGISMPNLKDKDYIGVGSAKPAADVKISRIKDYMCDLGPVFCAKCYSKCAYGKRYLNECINSE